MIKIVSLNGDKFTQKGMNDLEAASNEGPAF